MDSESKVYFNVNMKASELNNFYDKNVTNSYQGQRIARNWKKELQQANKTINHVRKSIEEDRSLIKDYVKLSK